MPDDLSGKPARASCGMLGLARGVVVSGPVSPPHPGHHRITVQSSRRRFAARLISGVMRWWNKGSCVGDLRCTSAAFRTGSGPQALPAPLLVISQLRQSAIRCRTAIILGGLRPAHARRSFGHACTSDLWHAWPGTRCRGFGLGFTAVSGPPSHNNSIKPTPLRGAAYFRR